MKKSPFIFTPVILAGCTSDSQLPTQMEIDRVRVTQYD